MTGQVEGRRAVLEALRSGRKISEVLISGRGGPVDEIRTLASRKGIAVRSVPRDEIERRAQTRTPQGVIAVVGSFAYASLDEIMGAQRRGPLLLVALDGVTDPQNAGAIARSAEAAGAHGLLVPERRSTPVTAVVEKAAAGAMAWLPVVRVTNLGRALEGLRAQGVWVAALDGGGEAAVWDLELATEPLCLVVGAEGAGVSRLVAERADVRVRIPMSGRVGSLNASVAAGIALFEVARRRMASGGRI